MSNNPKKYSVTISLVLTCLVIAGLAFAVFCLPMVLDWYFAHVGWPNQPMPTYVWALLYAAIGVAFLAGICLLRLLANVRKGNVFQLTSAWYLRIISWCCLGECLIFAALTLYFLFAPIIAFAAGFIGLMLHVVKNVIEEGTRIKSENDYTV